MIDQPWLEWLDPYRELTTRWVITLLHFLWQGVVIATGVAISQRLFSHASASTRYLINSAALLCLPLCVLVTFLSLEAPESRSQWRIVLPMQLIKRERYQT